MNKKKKEKKKYLISVTYPFIYLLFFFESSLRDRVIERKMLEMRKMVKLYIFRCLNFFPSVMLTKMLKLLTFFLGVPRSFDEKY